MPDRPIVANSEIGDPPDPTEADEPRNAVGIEQTLGQTFIIGNGAKEEWLTTETMGPLDLEEYR